MPVDWFGETTEGGNCGGIVPEGIPDELVPAGVSEGADPADIPGGVCFMHSSSVVRALSQSKRLTAPFAGS
jgi:hypothetical protein